MPIPMQFTITENTSEILLKIFLASFLLFNKSAFIKHYFMGMVFIKSFDCNTLTN